MNLVVARGLPGLESLDIAKYSRIVDEWAQGLAAANRAAEPFAKDEPTYRVGREFWMAGGMAVALAGPRFGIRYTSEGLDPGRPEQQFVHGLIDTKTGTCATMRVLYMAIGHRLGWPIKAVVSRDHMWARWDDGRPPGRGGTRFNLEATNAKSEGSMGSFNSLSDEEYRRWLGTSLEAIESGSDFSSLTPRQTLGVFLQGRAACWAVGGRWDRAYDDLRLAVACFPQNREIRAFHDNAAAEVGASPAWAGGPGAAGSRPPRPDRRTEHERRLAEVERINRENTERLRRLLEPPPNETPAPPWALDRPPQ